jgi:hypothetical protein
MTPENLRDVRRIARESRKWAEQTAKRRDCPKNLCGLCAVAAGHLHRALQREGYKSRIAMNNGHCFILLEDYVVDVTATQFGEAKVFIKKLTTVLQSFNGSHWLVCATFDTRRQARKAQIYDGWPAEQTVATPVFRGA